MRGCPTRRETSRRFSAKAIVNVGGPWVAKVLETVSSSPTEASVRHVKGSHIVVPRVHAEEHAYILQNADKRIVFVIPYHRRFTLIGTTDVAVTEFERPQISEDEIGYLLEITNAYLERPLARSDVMWAFSGVRPLYDDGKSDPSSITRDYVLKLDAGAGGAEPPVLSIYGGKLTTYRKLAEAALAALKPHFPAMPGPWTERDTLPGGDLPGHDRAAWIAELGRRYPGLPPALLDDLGHRHGSRATAVLGDAKTSADLGRDFGNGLCEREVDWFVREEWAQERGRRPLAAHQGRHRHGRGGARRPRRAPGRMNKPSAPLAARPVARVCLFCGANVGARASYAHAARTLGAILAREGLALVYGGGSVGLMNEAAEAVLAGGGRAVGVITEELMAREVGHAGLTEMHVVTDDARAQGADGEPLRRVHRAARRLRDLRRAVRDADLGPARHPRQAGRARQRRWLLRRLPRPARPGRAGPHAQAREPRDAVGRHGGRGRAAGARAAGVRPRPPRSGIAIRCRDRDDR